MKFRYRLIVATLAISSSACSTAPTLSSVDTALQSIVAGKPLASKTVWDDVGTFYALRKGSTAWVDDDGTVKRADRALAVLDRAADHGLDPKDYQRVELADAITRIGALRGTRDERATPLADLDVRITAALFSLAHDVALGRTSPVALDPRWKPRRTPPEFAASLAAAADGDLAAWLAQLRPVHPEYAALQEALTALRGQRDKGGWPSVPARALVPGRSDPAVVTMRQRLAASGQLNGSAATSGSALYDSDVVDAVKSFQEHHTLKANGVADADTIAAMNVPIDARLAQIALNLERWRWMPDEFGARHLLVNIPSYHVVAREQGHEVADIRVIVGKKGHETPVFSGEMATVVFSPYWNIPDAIADGETVPAIARDSQYLDRNHIDVMRATKGGVEPVDPRDVDWDNEDDLKGLMFRQRPGTDNALGHVKFLFPNPYDVYLHDTPADSLFERTGRALSHGCVRVEQPETLATYVLRGDAAWPDQKIYEAMNAGVERAVKLPETIPVHIVYFTTTVDVKGGVHFLTDVYGYDAKQQRQ